MCCGWEICNHDKRYPERLEGIHVIRIQTTKQDLQRYLCWINPYYNTINSMCWELTQSFILLYITCLCTMLPKHAKWNINIICGVMYNVKNQFYSCNIWTASRLCVKIFHIIFRWSYGTVNCLKTFIYRY